jgi:amino acid transporter
MVGMVATASSLAQFASVYPSAGSFITYITRAVGTKAAVAVGVITILGYIIAFGGIYIFVGSYIVQNVFGNPHVWGLTQIVTIAYGALVVAPVVVGLRFGVRVTVALYAFEVILLLVMSITILVRGGHSGLSATPFSWPSGHSTDVLLTFSLAVLAFGGFAGARGGLWSKSLAGISPRFRTPAAAAVAFVAPSIAIGVISTAFTDPGTASGFLSTYGILGLVIMYLCANIALIVEWARLRRRGVRRNPWLWVVVPVIGVAVLAIPVWGDLRPGQVSPYNTLPWPSPASPGVPG